MFFCDYNQTIIIFLAASSPITLKDSVILNGTIPEPKRRMSEVKDLTILCRNGRGKVPDYREETMPEAFKPNSHGNDHGEHIAKIAQPRRGLKKPIWKQLTSLVCMFLEQASRDSMRSFITPLMRCRFVKAIFFIFVETFVKCQQYQCFLES